MSRSTRSGRSRDEETNFSDELDDMLAAPALKPSLGFLGLNETVASPDVTAPPAVTASPGTAASPGTTVPPAASRHRDYATSPADTPSPVVAASPAITTSPAIAASPAVIVSTAVRKKRIHPCLNVQDGHSHIEQAVYQILWNTGSSQPDGTRISHLGLPRIAREARVHERNIGIIIRRLVQKQSIEILQKEVSDMRTARTYRVYADSAILERRKAAGLEWVIRGRGVEFVHPDSGFPRFRDEDLLIKEITAGGAVTAGGALTAGDPPA